MNEFYEKIKEIIDSDTKTRGCLCGRSEYCEVCSSFNRYNKMRDKIIAALKQYKEITK